MADFILGSWLQPQRFNDKDIYYDFFNMPATILKALHVLSHLIFVTILSSN